MKDDATPKWIKALGGKKYSLAILALVLGFILTILGKDVVAFAGIAGLGITSFAGANAYITGKYVEKDK